METNALIAPQAASLEAYSANLKAKLEFCQLLISTGMCPQSIKTPQQALAAILYGQEIGFSPMQALQSVVVIQSKPTLDVNGLQAKMIQAGAQITVVELSNDRCVLDVVRPVNGTAWKMRHEYSIEDAKLAGLAGKDNWKRMPKDMNYARAISRAARRQFADVLKNFYGKEEMLDATNGAPLEPLNITPAAPLQAAESLAAVTQTVLDSIAPVKLEVPPAVEEDAPDWMDVKTYRYDLSTMAEAQGKAAAAWLERNGATNDGGNVYAIKREVPQLAEFEVKPLPADVAKARLEEMKAKRNGKGAAA